MILAGNSRPTALVGGLCALREGLYSYEETFATIVFQDGVIKEVIKLDDSVDIDKHITDIQTRYNDSLIVRLYDLENPCHVFPGLVDVHNHIDYNMMPIWERPVEQPWDNRHEWRNCTEYTNDIKNLFSFIFDNWSKYSEPGKNEDSYTVIQFFSELQAIAGGTTALQESTEISYNAADGHGVTRNTEHILLRSTGVSKDVGLDSDQKINSVIDFFKPDINKIKEEEKKAGIPEKEYLHPPIDTSTWEITEPENKATKVSYFREYLNFLHKNSVEEIHKKTGGYLVHLAEGRAGNLRPGQDLGEGIDAYSRLEFKRLKEEICKIPGYREKVTASRLTVIHGCGIDLRDDDDINFINDCSIRVVWSPVSNLLLYDDTPNYLLSRIRPELICLGSDWAPSGSKHVWDEAKFAQEFTIKYFYKDSDLRNINDIFLDMISYIPAQAIGSGKIGFIAEGCYADFYIVSEGRQLPKQDMDAALSDIFNKFSDFESIATIINGNLIFGTQEVFDAFGIKGSKVVSLEADLIDESGKEIIVDEGAKNLRVCIPDIKISVDGKTSDVHIDFDAALKTLDAMFKDFNKTYNKCFIRSRLLSSYDLPYQKQVSSLKKKFDIG